MRITLFEQHLSRMKPSIDTHPKPSLTNHPLPMAFVQELSFKGTGALAGVKAGKLPSLDNWYKCTSPHSGGRMLWTWESQQMGHE